MTFFSKGSSLNEIRPHLPQKILYALDRLDSKTQDKISELRLRADGIATITLEGKNYTLTLNGIEKNTKSGIVLSKEDIDEFIYKICKGSVFAHEDTLNNFYLSYGACRIGIGGSFGKSSSGEYVLSNIRSLNIRLAHHIPDCSQKLFLHIEKEGFKDGGGILITSSAGVGKTTLLRDLSVKLSSTCENFNSDFQAKRVCIIDERSEIFMPDIFKYCNADFITNGDKITSLETAVRVLSPEIIIFDEIASPKEAELITKFKNSGCVFIASHHAATPEGALSKDYIRQMFEQGVFGYIYSLKRTKDNVEGELYSFKDIKC